MDTDLCLHRADYAYTICDRREFWEIFGDLKVRGSINRLSRTFRFTLLRIQRVDVTQTSIQHQPNHALRFTKSRRLLACSLCSHKVRRGENTQPE